MLNKLIQRIRDWAAQPLLRDLDFAIEAAQRRGADAPAPEPWRIQDGIIPVVHTPIPAAVQEESYSDISAAIHEANEQFRTQFGTPYQQGTPYLLPTTNTPLDEWGDTERRTILEQTHLAYERNPWAKRGVAYTRMFAIGGGATITAVNKDVQDVLDAFMDNPDNAFRETEKGILDALLIDGDIFMRYFEDAGEVVWAPLLPWGVKEIRHDPGFFRRVLSYHYQIPQGDGTGTSNYYDAEIPAEEILHVAINRMMYDQRGKPELFAVLPYFRAYKEWLENRARQNFHRGAILYWAKLIGANAAQIASKLQLYKRPPNPSSVLVTGDKEEWTQFTANIGATDAGEDGRKLLLAIAAGFGLPEHFLADGSNANLASATAQQMPALRTFMEYQDIMRDQVLIPTFKRVIRVAVAAGTLPAEVEVQDADGEKDIDADPVPAEKAFDVQYAELADDDPKNLIEALVLAMTTDIMSTQTATSLAPWPLDYKQEQKRIDAERQADMERIMRGEMPAPPGMAGPDGTPNGAGPQNDNEDEPQGQPAAA